jgi:hypothetical protein
VAILNRHRTPHLLSEASFKVSSSLSGHRRVLPSVPCTPSIGESHARCGACWPMRKTRDGSV